MENKNTYYRIEDRLGRILCRDGKAHLVIQGKHGGFEKFATKADGEKKCPPGFMVKEVTLYSSGVFAG